VLGSNDRPAAGGGRIGRLVAAGSDESKYTNRLTLANGILAWQTRKGFGFRQVPAFEFSSWWGRSATDNCEKQQARNNGLISSGYWCRWARLREAAIRAGTVVNLAAFTSASGGLVAAIRGVLPYQQPVAGHAVRMPDWNSLPSE
jgi:hypothetical protein